MADSSAGQMNDQVTHAAEDSGKDLKEESRSLAGVLRGPILWSAVLASAALLVLSIVGAFIGDERARKLFNSVPLVVFWFFWIAILLAGIVFSPVVRRRLGGLAMHFGTILIFIGAMVGSNAGHDVSTRFFGSSKIPKGFMVINEGGASHDILDKKTEDPIAKLPFDIRLVDFRMEYYESDGSWSLGAVRRDEHGHRQSQTLRWAKGQSSKIAGTDLAVEVLQYLESARPIVPKENSAALEIVPDSGSPLRVPAVAGKEARLEAPAITVKILRVFDTLIVRGRGDIADAPGPPRNRAIEFEVKRADGAGRKAYIFESGMTMPPDVASGVEFRYVGGKPTTAVADPDSGLPAMRLRVADGSGRTAEAWLIPSREEGHAVLPVRSLPGFDDAPELMLILLPPNAPVKTYQSVVEVIEENEVVLNAVIEVNHPLHYGGYHFYQHSYDSKRGKYTVLSVSSDSGLSVVWAGFILLGGGAFWQMWVRPAVKRLRRQSANGD